MSQFEENATFICGHRRTGTTLLVNLLDNHPQLCTYPVDSGFFYAYYPLATTQNWTKEKKVNQMINFMIKNLAGEIEKSLSQQDKQDLNFPIKEFKAEFLKQVELRGETEKDMLLSLVTAFQKFTPNQNTQTRWVEKTTSTEIYATQIKKWFPKAKFIHVIRDPRDNWASLKSGWEKRYKEFNDDPRRILQSLIERGLLGMQLAKHNKKLLGEDYLIIRYEDLVNSSEITMQKICQFLNIEFNSSLLTPTVCSKFWKGNNFQGVTFQGISPTHAGAWEQRITEQEAKVIEYNFGDLMNYFNYETIYPLKETVGAAVDHYKWYNFAQKFSYNTTTHGKIKENGSS